MSLITIIAYHPTGYELRIGVTFEELSPTLRRLSARGYTPTREPVLTAEGLPICPRHGVPMQQRNRNGDIWYSHKLVHPETGETVYCRGYAGASSPGYDILLPAAAPAAQPLSQDSQPANINQQQGELPPPGSSQPLTEIQTDALPERLATSAQDQPLVVNQDRPNLPARNGRLPQVPAAVTTPPQAAIHTALFGPRP